jgi:putative transposase
LESRLFSITGITRHPDQEWVKQIARSMIATRTTHRLDSTQADGGVKAIRLPARSPNLNPFAERCVHSVKQECLSKLILFGEGPLSRTLAQFSAHYHSEEITKGRTTSCYLLELATNPKKRGHPVECRHRLGGLLK